MKKLWKALAMNIRQCLQNLLCINTPLYAQRLEFRKESFLLTQLVYGNHSLTYLPNKFLPLCTAPFRRQTGCQLVTTTS